jgi:carboxypeptidase Q
MPDPAGRGVGRLTPPKPPAVRDTIETKEETAMTRTSDLAKHRAPRPPRALRAIPSLARFAAIVALASGLASLPRAASAAPGGTDPSSAPGRLVGRALGETPLMADLAELCDRVGGRPTGSPACVRAVEWGAAKFRAAGIDRVTVEPFAVPELWLPVSAEASCVSPEIFPIRIAAAPYSPSTPGGSSIEAPVVDAENGLPEDYAKLGAAARGAIALVHNAEMKSLDDLFAEYLSNGRRIEAAKAAGIVAILMESSRPRGLLYRHPASVVGKMTALPMGIVSREQAGRLSRLCAAASLVPGTAAPASLVPGTAAPGTAAPRVRLSISNRTGPAYESKNVVAEIRGREHPEEIVLIGAHLDSWDLGTGAEDNGVNAAMLIDLARGFHELGIVPRRTIRFVLFTGEEQGIFGSAGYVRSHARELDDHVLAVTFDIGSGRTRGFYLNGREDLRDPVARALEAAAGLGAATHPLDGIDGTDNFDFLLEGIPNLVAEQDSTDYLPNYHAESDTFDKVNAREARANEAIAAVLLYGIAEAPGRAGKRQTREEVERLLAATHLDEQMKAFDQWDDWVKGRRGLPPSPSR